MEYDEYGDRLDGFGVDEDTRPLTRFLSNDILNRIEEEI